MFDFIPKQVRSGLTMLPPVKRISDQVLADLGIPRSVLVYINYPTDFDSTKTQTALEGTGISVPPLGSYADRLWDYWERNLDPDLFKDRSLSGAIAGKVVLITGASSGIGKATAIKCGEAGADVLLVARTPEKLEETKAEIEEAGGKAHIHQCDLSDLDDVERMAKEVLDQHDRVDVLVNNAGRSIRRSVELSYERFHDFERTMQLNYFGALRLILSLLPAMRKRSKGRKGGHIINVSSIGVQTHTPRFSAYVASKAALDAWSRCVASEVIDDGVHITTIYMPLVRTPMIAPTKMYDAFPTSTPEEAAEMITNAMISQAEEGRDPAWQFRRAPLQRRAEGLGRDPQHRLQALSRIERRQAQGRREARGEGEGALDRGRRLRVPDEGSSLVVGSARGYRDPPAEALGVGVRGPAAPARSGRGDRKGGHGPARLRGR